MSQVYDRSASVSMTVEGSKFSGGSRSVNTVAPSDYQILLGNPVTRGGACFKGSPQGVGRGPSTPRFLSPKALDNTRNHLLPSPRRLCFRQRLCVIYSLCVCLLAGLWFWAKFGSRQVREFRLCGDMAVFHTVLPCYPMYFLYKDRTVFFYRFDLGCAKLSVIISITLSTINKRRKPT